MIPSEKYAQIDQLAEDFVARIRRGERPTYKDYVARHPELADEIRELFPALVEMEHVKVASEIAGPSLCLPRQIGDYRIIREVGRGGMGVVYEAEQQSLGRRVALKIMPARNPADRTTLERFKREARTAAQLHHTNIVPVFEVGQEQEIYYYAMQFIQGQGLDQVIVELCRLRLEAAQETDRSPRPVNPETPAEASAVGPLAESMLTGRFSIDLTAPFDDLERGAEPSPTASDAASTYSAALPGRTERSSVQSGHGHYFRSVARIGEQAAAALSYAHQRGIVHRDIKPSNLLLDTVGTVWMTDFGLAKADDDGLTQSGDVLGTFRYMAPERFAGLGDARSDIYSLGLTLYELLVLRPAFNARDRLQLIEQVKQCQAQRPRGIDPRIPHDLETIVLKAMDRDPKRRYQSSDELTDDLRHFLAGEPIKARRTGELERLRLWCRRNPIIAAMVGAVAILLLVLAAGATVSALWLRDERDLAIGNEGRAQAAEQAASKAKRDALAKLWDSNVVAARAGRMSRSPGQRFGSLRSIEQALALPLPPDRSKDELRTEAIASLLLPDLEVAKEWRGWPSGSRGFAVDSAFERYARGDAHGNISVGRIADDKTLFVLPGSSPAPDTYGVLALSPDGHYLSQMSDDGHQRIWRIDVEPPAVAVPADYTACAFSPDSRQVAVAIGDEIRFYELPSGQELRHSRFPGIRPYRLDWNPRRPVLAVCDRTNVLLIDAETGEMQLHLPVANGTSWCDWHPEGRILAIAIGDFDPSPKVTIWDMVTRKQLRLPLEGLKSRGVFVCFDQSGDRLITTDWSHVWRLWDVRTGHQLLAHAAGGNGIWFSADNASVGLDASGKSLRVYRYASGAELCTLVHRGAASEPGFNARECCRLDADGRLLAVRAGNGIAVIDVVRGEELVYLPLAGSSPFAQDNSGALLTHGPAGLLRWPVSTDKGIRSYGPPDKLVPAMCGTGEVPGTSADGKMWAFPRMDEGAVAVSLPEGRELSLPGQKDVRFAAVSPDGSWIATGSHSALDRPVAKVWNARSGEHVRDLPVGEYCAVSFSPAGKWLVTSGGGTRIWSVRNWQPTPAAGEIAQLAAFTDDDSLVAMEGPPGSVRLVVPDTGRELARLTAPETERLSPMCFTRDGSRLVCRGTDTESLYIFDLAVIRGQLFKLGLDWDPSQPAKVDRSRSEPINVRFVENTSPLARGLKKSEIDRHLLAIALDPFNAGERLELGIQLSEQGEMEAADEQLRLALVLKSDLPAARSSRSIAALGTCGQWHLKHERRARAAADYILLAELEPTVSERALQAATLLLAAGDRAGYRESCRLMLQRFRNTSSPNNAERTAKACLISDELKDELPEASRLAEFAARKGAKSGDHLWFELTAGMAEYREGLFSAAARRLAKNHESTQGIEILDELTCLFEAMALIKSGHTAEAEQLIKAAAPAVNNRFGRKSDDFSFNWHDWLIARMALQEAQRLLSDAPNASK